MSIENLKINLRDNTSMSLFPVVGKQGMPNTFYIGDGKHNNGFMELIHIDKFGKRVTTGLRLEQVNWLSNYIEQGGSAWVLVKIGRDFTCLFWGETCKGLMNKPTAKDFMSRATWSKRGNLKKEDWAEMEDVILNAA
tara:strand:- start:381 stop:791 length:411 start_codon:yes stop_codon:yes gene_type:complete